MIELADVPGGKSIYFASDFHLGIPTYSDSREREKIIIRWLDQVSPTAHAIFLVGDLFDFWFEYKHVIPKGYIRFFGKLAEIRDKGIPIYIFTGNHDMWMFDYIPRELDIPIIRENITLTLNDTSFFIGHGDGLGPGDGFYKIIKRIFRNRICQRVFAFLHPYMGMGIANSWSKNSRHSHVEKDKAFQGDHEFLYQFCLEQEEKAHYDYYIFGHRHKPLTMSVNEKSTYINLGEWMSDYTYAVFDGHTCELKTFQS